MAGPGPAGEAASASSDNAHSRENATMATIRTGLSPSGWLSLRIYLCIAYP